MATIGAVVQFMKQLCQHNSNEFVVWNVGNLYVCYVGHPQYLTG